MIHTGRASFNAYFKLRNNIKARVPVFHAYGDLCIASSPRQGLNRYLIGHAGKIYEEARPRCLSYGRFDGESGMVFFEPSGKCILQTALFLHELPLSVQIDIKTALA
jgi:hypothetical protein